jgi:lipid A 4'-phosphatase
MSLRPFLVLALAVIVPLLLVVFPGIDLAVSAWFFRAGEGFYLDKHAALVAFHKSIYYGARVFVIAVAAAIVMALLRRKKFLRLPAKAWIFLMLGFWIGPALIANGIFKDHWDRARPREIVEFGGTASFSPALMMSDQCERNCSFVAGDPSLAFYLTAFAYVVGLTGSRRVFWGFFAFGALAGAMRIMMGGHFLSDVVFAALFMLLAGAILHAAMYGRKETAERWKSWLGMRL